ncbi:unnamed protein product, partial [Mesorhabditis belari]|uniref:Uncharacterized protein n=1 Tax=Mesorhabditis belari TaxID=2138241 RepID=A0AAF3FBL5_9BILA
MHTVYILDFGIARKYTNHKGTLKCKNDYQKILTYIDRLEYTDHVDDQFTYEKLKRIAAQQSINIDGPYDFEPPSKK